MMAREVLPGETDPFEGLREDIEPSSIEGVIRAVDKRRGLVKVQLQYGATNLHDVRIPIFQLSVLGSRSSWIRMMPQVGDVVSLVRDLHGRFHIVNYEAIDYRQLTESHDANLFLFRELEEGEYELRSSGSATIFGSADGVLRLAGGPAQLTLRREEADVTQQAGLHKLVTLGCEVRFGEVRRRTLPTDAEETPVDGAWAYRVSIVNQLNAKQVDLKMGHVIDDATSAPTTSGQGQPLRIHLRVYDAAGAQIAHEVKVDTAGNVSIDSAATATAFDLTALAALLHLRVKDFVLQPSGTYRVGSSTSAENMLLGQQTKSMLTDLLSTLRDAIVATSWGPASFSPETIAAIEAIQTQYINSDAILSDYAFVSKAPG